jgi:hypothetical protein
VSLFVSLCTSLGFGRAVAADTRKETGAFRRRRVGKCSRVSILVCQGICFGLSRAIVTQGRKRICICVCVGRIAGGGSSCGRGYTVIAIFSGCVCGCDGVATVLRSGCCGGEGGALIAVFRNSVGVGVGVGIIVGVFVVVFGLHTVVAVDIFFGSLFVRVVGVGRRLNRTIVYVRVYRNASISSDHARWSGEGCQGHKCKDKRQDGKHNPGVPYWSLYQRIGRVTTQ